MIETSTTVITEPPVISLTVPPVTSATTPPSTSATSSETKYLKKTRSKIELRKKSSTIGKLLTSNNSSFNSTSSLPSSVNHTKATNNKKFGRFFKKISTEVNSFFANIRSISDDVFLTDDIVRDLFVNSESDDSSLDKILIRTPKLHTPEEEIFIEEYKKVKNLDKMAELRQRNEEIKSSTTVASKLSLQDAIRQYSDSMTEPSEYEDESSFQDVDLFKLRQEFAQSPLIKDASQVGNVLWQYRRKKWLYCAHPEKVEERIKDLSIEYIPRESYIKVYNNLVDKGRTLKPGKRMNLADLVEVINVGWVAEEKWDRAAKGLP